MSRIIAVMLLCASVSSAQFDEFSLNFYGALSVPLDEYGDDDGGFKNSGFATVGVSGGIGVAVPLGHRAISAVADVSFLVHFFSEDKAENDWQLALSNSSIDGGHYFHIPVLAGVRIAVPDLAAPVEPYATAQAGFCYIAQSEIEGTVLNNRAEISMESTVAPAFSIGGGVLINDAFTLGFRFITFGSPELEYNIDVAGIAADSGVREFDMVVFQIMLGYRIEF